ncbi:MAG: glycyl-radical enzyme activating protein [Eubacteriales bacterium]
MHPVANIFNIQRFSVDDGPGIRTTVFFKGCPLHCIWCHNPESARREPELMYSAQKCIYCGGCASVCPRGVHLVAVREGETPVHTLNRENCTACGACARVCCTKALELCGRDADIDEIMREVLADSVFYETSGGGVTLSGGEPLYQPEAALALCRAAKEANLHVAMETCGYASEAVLGSVLPYVDLFLFDYKAEADNHPSLTGVPLEPILRSLAQLDAAGADVILRCPIIPGCNDTETHFASVAELARRYACIREVHLEPYHPLGISKCEQLGRKPVYENRSFADRELLRRRAETMTAACGKPVRVN